MDDESSIRIPIPPEWVPKLEAIARARGVDLNEAVSELLSESFAARRTADGPPPGPNASATEKEHYAACCEHCDAVDVGWAERRLLEGEGQPSNPRMNQ